MTPPALLIAGREFRAYVATASFWVALALGPAFVAGGALLIAHHVPLSQPQSLILTRTAGGEVEARYSEAFPLSRAARAQVIGIIAQDGRLNVRPAPADTAGARQIDGAAASRFVLMIMLWMTLAGSLGMLLQATVRERANRSLESLLAAATPWDIVGGKLLGIGAVSMLVVGAWLGSTALLATLVSVKGNAGSSLLLGLAQPLVLLRAVGLYGLSFAFYGLTTIAIGARARDSADAQNLARPMFGLLLVVFFTALFSSAGATSPFSWLAYLPPFAPFLLLLHPQPLLVEVASSLALFAATGAAGWWAAQAITSDPSPIRLRKSRIS